ncbi:helix-turn-helix transcriptional regulator [Leuconostoc fallax]|uniref:helix-turn-helix domain-containing protein n=1 Tax=Leuconostoc fallax TaxID=1251 RepID=UPI002090DA55|nr:helix-turn-helix transcriptional regulator [Leuconostoc fallax]MCO6184123.1 helix-turn-helix domain-containing protein [Leuconostoc fallax]
MINVEKFISTRKRLKISQMALCADICTQATLSKFEKHQQVPAFDIMVALCERLGLTLNDVFPINVKAQQTHNEQVLIQAMRELFYQNISKFEILINQIEVEKIIDNELPMYQIMQYFSAVILKQDGLKAKQIIKKIDIANLNKSHQLLFYAITSHYYYQRGRFKEAHQAFEDVWRYQKEIVTVDYSGCQEAIVYLLAQYQMLIENYKFSMVLATYGLDLTNASSSTYFLENFFWILVEASDTWQSQDFIVNEMIENARVIAKIHKNEDILQKISQRKGEK